MITRVRDTTFRVTAIMKTIKFQGVSAGQEGSRLWDRTHDLRITRAAHTTHYPLYLRLRFCSARSNSASAAWLDASSRHNPCRDDESDE